MILQKKHELIIKTRQKAAEAHAPNLNMAAAFSPALSSIFVNMGAVLKPIFKHITGINAAPGAMAAVHDAAELSSFYKVDAPEEQYPELLKRLNEMDEIEAAYIKPAAEAAFMDLNNMTAEILDASAPAVASFRNRQIYLDQSPMGVGVQHAWNLPGGKGAGVNIIDIEWGWRFTHEDLRMNQGGVISGSNSDDDNHGTAVLGVFGGDDNNFGIVGISPEANVSSISLQNNQNTTSEAITIAADKLRAGDIILLEVHRPGPLSYQGNGQFGYIGIEWWPDDFAAIQYAVAKGIIVVEAAGNGGQDLDQDIYDSRPVNHPLLGTFPENWTNPFNMDNKQSGAIIVGAGLPPEGTHGRNAQPDFGDVYHDRGRCFFSNYGARVDTQGWGWEVTTSGYGDLQGGVNKDAWYTDQFSGTSSASPLVVGVLACLQGILKAKGKMPLTPAGAVQLLRNSGSPQQPAPGFTFFYNMNGSGYAQQHPARLVTQRIGNRPDLQQLIKLI